jgi:ATP-dependent Clp protease ATP-binding subunit ClpC
MKKSELTRFVREIASELRSELDDELDPVDLDDDETFESAVTTIAESEVHANDLFALARDRDELVSCIALAAIAERRHMPPEFEKWAWRAFRKTTSAQDEYVLRALLVHGKPPLIGRALRVIDESVAHDAIARFVGARLAAGEPLSADVLDEVSDLADELGELLDDNEELLGPGFREVFETWRAGTDDADFLTGIGRMWASPYDSPPALLSGRRAEIVDVIAERLAETPRRSVLLVGQHGIGKTSLLRAAIDRVGGVAVFEASAAQLQAGAVYVGELEARVKEFVDSVRGRAMVWHLPDLEAALHAGQHQRSRFGMLDALLPAVQAGDLTIVAEASPEAAERLLAERSHLATAFHLIQIRPLEEAEAVSVALHALEHDGYDITATEETLRGAYELAEQFLPRISSPGNLLRLVRTATVEAATKGQAEIGQSDLVAALSRSSGLPLLMLDASIPLRLEDTREFFARRVLGQEEAVDAVVERIAMIKAGVSDPTRPLGVFLFVGPTGTGKTEIAKALAEFLFGSAERLVRLDMSEFQSPESFDRLLADTSIDTYGAPLVASIRKDPFAVVLLDEFDKAARPVWDLFLQVFDDGRLTDQHGRIVDLRRCVIILTSNIGSSIATRAGVGFDPTADPFRPESVTRALEHSFRPEFRNRIDRIVVFRPFERAQMRALLDKELAAALTRRGLRERPWAVELDDSAYEYIIDQGFSPALGARPLKRALERHLLARLAAFIVEHRTPSGDQFLLVSSPGGDGIEVTFVDPDAEGSPDEPPREADTTIDSELDLRSLALAPRGDPTHTRFLLDELQRIRTAVQSNGVEGRKRAGLETMSRPDFWDDDSRFGTLAEIEYLDRLETALETAKRLCDRLGRPARDDRGAQLHKVVARRLYVLDRALLGLAEGAPADVFLRARRVRDAHEAHEEQRRHDALGASLPTILADMYTAWARQRGMRLERLASADDEHLFAISGLGCSTILAPEAGYHVLELTDEREGKRVERETAAVDVVAWDPRPALGSEDLLARAGAALRTAPANPAIVRRYRLPPDPLVRDAVRGYRTGRIDRVLAGDFDLF